MGKDALVQQLVGSFDNWPASKENASEKPGHCGSSARMTQ